MTGASVAMTVWFAHTSSSNDISCNVQGWGSGLRARGLNIFQAQGLNMFKAQGLNTFRMVRAHLLLQRHQLQR